MTRAKVLEITSTSIALDWYLDCSDRIGIVNEFKITYCPVSSANESDQCIQGQEYVHTVGSNAESVVLTNLSPWTLYKVLYVYIMKYFRVNCLTNENMQVSVMSYGTNDAFIF